MSRRHSTYLPFVALLLIAFSKIAVCDPTKAGPLVSVSDSDLDILVAPHVYMRFHVSEDTVLEKGDQVFSIKDVGRLSIGDVVEISSEPYGAAQQAIRVVFKALPSAKLKQSVMESPIAVSTHNRLSSVDQSSRPPSTSSLFGMKLPEKFGDDISNRNNVTGLDAFMEEVRLRAESILAHRPNYIVHQTASRYVNFQQNPDWRPEDVLESEVIFQNNIERHDNVKINGRLQSVDYMAVKGSKGAGEVSSFVQQLFSPNTQARFVRTAGESLNERRTVLYTFTSAATWLLGSGFFWTDSSASGRLWIDPSTKEMVRIEFEKVPVVNFPIVKCESRISFKDVLIGSEMAWLPMASDLVYWHKKPGADALIRSNFTDYRKFEAESSITFH